MRTPLWALLIVMMSAIYCSRMAREAEHLNIIAAAAGQNALLARSVARALEDNGAAVANCKSAREWKTSATA